MSNFLEQLTLEIKRQEKIYSTAESKLVSAPDGSLTIRNRKRKKDFYLNLEDRKSQPRKRKQININDNQKLILQLTDKLIQQKRLLRSKTNLLYLNKLYRKYQSTDLQHISANLGSTYQQALNIHRQEQINKQKQQPYPKAKFDPRFHVHETDQGELVRSKSEQIILNALYPYNLVVHYEEEFIYKYPVEGLNRVFPDFTIILPNGERIIWEHLGRLDNPEYCYRTALKLNLYQQNGYVLGENLIITMDDHKGNISSSCILHAIQEHILPKLQNTEIPLDI